MSWKILYAKVNKCAQVVIFNQKLPANLIRCTGIATSVTNKLSPLVKVCGEVSLSLNNQQIHPIHLEAVSQAQPIGNHNKLFPLDELLTSNCLITGYYMDKSDFETFEPYTLQIYLKCTKS